MSWGVKTTGFEASEVSVGGSDVLVYHGPENSSTFSRHYGWPSTDLHFFFLKGGVTLAESEQD